MNDEIGLGVLRRGDRKAAAQRRRDGFASGIDVDQLDFCPRELRRQRGDKGTDDAGADDGDPVTRTRCAIPQPVDRRLHVGGERGAALGDIVGNGDDGIFRDDKSVLMRMQAEYAAADCVLGPLLNNADHGIAIFDGRGNSPSWNGQRHPAPFALGHFTAENKTFSAPASGSPAAASFSCWPEAVAAGRSRDSCVCPE